VDFGTLGVSFFLSVHRASDPVGISPLPLVTLRMCLGSPSKKSMAQARK